jgi:hypothetical protein
MSSIKTPKEIGREKQKRTETADPVLLMLGVGSQLWQQESGDDFVERLRSEDPPPSPATRQLASPARNLSETVWLRMEHHRGEEFRTATGLPFTFNLEGAGIWFFRDGKRINRKLTRAQLQVAISRCPLKSTTEIKDLMDYSYLFAVLMDPRIRGQEW